MLGGGSATADFFFVFAFGTGSEACAADGDAGDSAVALTEGSLIAAALFAFGAAVVEPAGGGVAVAVVGGPGGVCPLACSLDTFRDVSGTAEEPVAVRSAPLEVPFRLSCVGRDWELAGLRVEAPGVRGLARRGAPEVPSSTLATLHAAHALMEPGWIFH